MGWRGSGRRERRQANGAEAKAGGRPHRRGLTWKDGVEACQKQSGKSLKRDHSCGIRLFKGMNGIRFFFGCGTTPVPSHQSARVSLPWRSVRDRARRPPDLGLSHSTLHRRRSEPRGIVSDENTEPTVGDAYPTDDCCRCSRPTSPQV